MADTNIRLNLDPKKVLQSLNDMSEEMKNLATTVENSLGKEAPKSLSKFENAAEQGSNKVATYFRNLGTRVKEDLKTAFDVGKIFSGLNLASSLGQGIKEVFNLEKAFDKLNTRLGMTGRAYQDFKKNVGTQVSSTGQKLEDVFPGIETVASKGNVKDPGQLAQIGKALGEAKAITGEDVTGLADSVVEILKNQGKKVNASSFASTLDSIQGTRTSGSFKSAGEAASAIQGITSVLSPEQAKAMGLGTREIGGLAAQASQAGAGGQDILKHILETATQAGGKEQLNAIFGTSLFKNGKLDSSAFGKINKKRFGQYSEQVLSSATGANQADLSRFLDSMKDGMADFKKVTEGSNETASQFAVATDNLASGLDQFKQKTINATREVGDDLSDAAKQLLKGDFKSALGDMKHAGSSLYENKGVVGGAVGTAALAAVLTGSGVGGLLKRMPGVGGKLGGLAGGFAGAELAKQAGATPVYVVNASEIGGSSVLSGAGGALGKLAKFGGGGLKALGGVGLAGGLAYEAGSALSNTKLGDALDPVIDKIFKAFDVGGVASGQQKLDSMKTEKTQSVSDHEALAAAVSKGVESAMVKSSKNKEATYTNPSSVSGRGGSL